MSFFWCLGCQKIHLSFDLLTHFGANSMIVITKIHKMLVSNSHYQMQYLRASIYVLLHRRYYTAEWISFHFLGLCRIWCCIISEFTNTRISKFCPKSMRTIFLLNTEMRLNNTNKSHVLVGTVTIWIRKNSSM